MDGFVVEWWGNANARLWVQRRHWALDVLRDAGVKSVLDIGCGPGSLLQTLVVPPPSVTEPPIKGDDGSTPEGKELFIKVGLLT